MNPRLALCLAAVVLLQPAEAAGQRDRSRGESTSISSRTRDLRLLDGVIRLWVDDAAGRILLELPPPGDDGVAVELLYVGGLGTGLGSNPVGLDRGLQGPTRWIALRRVGGKLLVEQRNATYRADSPDPYERRAASDSFATSILWAAEMETVEADGRSLVDFTPFLLRDAVSIAEALAASGQGRFERDASRSVVDTRASLAFPDNVELEAILTFSGESPGDHVRSTAADPRSLTFAVHHSLIRLPDDGFRPRPFDPRAGSYAVAFQDYATPIDAPLTRRFIARHRLTSGGDPIVFHVDRGAPEPIRSALLEGAGWWSAAFAAAGFPGGFRVELLPEGAHPLDARYHVIQWVHRATRGWSYGGGVIDPRTGEIVKGNVLLGSLRVRHDRLLFEGLAGTEKTGSGRPDDPIRLALARIRQLAAHEVGHALGLSHNFAASTYGDRASVMDYPAPLVGLTADDGLDFSRAYGVGVGSWDRHAIRYAYAEPPTGTDEVAWLASIVRDGLDAGLRFLTDADARPAGASDPRANLWDNGDDPLQELAHVLEVRRRALQRFGEGNVRPGVPLAHLEEVLAPLYFHHRYQLDAAVKLVGGMEYDYALRGDGQVPTRNIDAARQRRAIDAVLAALDPGLLDLPDPLLALLAPRPHGEERNREMFDSRTAPAFDALGAAATAAAMALDGLLQPERLARMIDQHRRDPASPGVDELLDRLAKRAFPDLPQAVPRRAEVARTVQSVVVEHLLRLAGDGSLSIAIRSQIEAALADVGARLATRRPVDATEGKHAAWLAAAISRFLERADTTSRAPWSLGPPPPGSPIGEPGWPLRGCSDPR